MWHEQVAHRGPNDMISSLSHSIYNLQVKSVVDTNFSVYTGIGDLSQVGQYIWWEGRPQISEWGTPAARMLNGTAGFLFHPGVSKKEQLDVFISEIFRCVYCVCGSMGTCIHKYCCCLLLLLWQFRIRQWIVIDGRLTSFVEVTVQLFRATKISRNPIKCAQTKFL